MNSLQKMHQAKACSGYAAASVDHATRPGDTTSGAMPVRMRVLQNLKPALI